MTNDASAIPAEVRLGAVVNALRGQRVVPAVPEGFRPGVSMSEDDTPIRVGRDGSSGWSVFVRYVNAKGELSQRRLTCQKLVGYGYGQIDTVFAYCHETRRLKNFRVDCMQEMIDLATGEVVDPARHLADLHRDGLMGLKDKALDDFASVLVFLAKCDGEFHPLEEEAMADALSRYCVRFGGEDCVVNALLDRLDAIAPDGRDLVASLGRINRAANGPALARLILSSATEIVDADGRITMQEIDWGGMIQGRLKQPSVRDGGSGRTLS